MNDSQLIFCYFDILKSEWSIYMQLKMIYYIRNELSINQLEMGYLLYTANRLLFYSLLYLY